MFSVGELLDVCKGNNDKKIFLCLVDEEEIKIPMGLQYYVADDIFFFEVNRKNKGTIKNFDIIDMLEEEAKNDTCWADNIYVAPMERIGNCELRFAKDFKQVIEDDIFYNCYNILRIKEFDNAIVIYLKD